MYPQVHINNNLKCVWPIRVYTGLPFYIVNKNYYFKDKNVIDEQLCL